MKNEPKVVPRFERPDPVETIHESDIAQGSLDVLKTHYDLMANICDIVQDLPTSKLQALAGPVFRDLQKLIDAR
jgi:hypothetical protein